MASVTQLLVIVVSVVALAWAFPYDNSPVDLDSLSPEDFAQLMGYLPNYSQLEPAEVPTEEFNTDGQGLGSVTAVDVDSQGHIWAFHRADRPWTPETFDIETNELSEEAKVPIKGDLIVQLDPTTGKIVSKFGENLFNVPHGLKIDSKDNIWVTDVGRHQVLRFAKNTTTPDLVLGETFVPGNDDVHFCKPTDVAVAENGDFFVSDGYCNSRILKFSKDGTLLAKWGTSVGNEGVMTPYHMTIPHSITLVEELDIVCVADRENERVTCFNAGLGSGRQLGSFNRTVVSPGEIGRVFVVYFNKAGGNLLAAAQTSQMPFWDGEAMIYPPRGFTYTLGGELVGAWAPITQEMANKGPSLVHGMCVSNDGQDFYMSDVLQGKVHKYSSRPRQQTDRQD